MRQEAKKIPVYLTREQWRVVVRAVRLDVWYTLKESNLDCSFTVHALTDMRVQLRRKRKVVR